MPRVALITDHNAPTGIADDAPFISALADRGIDTRHVAWDEEADWTGVDAALIRTPWGYFRRAAEFLEWVDAVPVRIFNPPAIVRWNADKRYLFDLGVRIPPTRIVSAREVTIEGESVVKPVVSGGGHDTWRVMTSAELPPLAEGRWLIQQYLPAVATEGELSVVVIDGTITHAVRKRPRDGSFLVHEEHGGRVEAAEVPGDAADLAIRAVAAVRTRFGELPLYARVDTVPDDGHPCLIELELIEPELFFRFGPEAAGRLADALRRRLYW